MRGPRWTRPGAVAVMLAALLAAAACGKAEPKETGFDRGDGVVRLYGTDGNMSNSFGDTLKDLPGVLDGMKGTTPLTPLSDDFKRRVRTVDPTLPDFNYSGEAYDAVVIPALAAEIARTTDATTVAKYVNGVTVGGTVCESVKVCLDLIHAGQNIQYRGVSLRRSGFTDAGEPSSASYGAVNFGRDNHLDDGKTEYVGAGDEAAQTKQPSPTPPPSNKPLRGAAPLKIGGLLPHTGSLAIAGPPMFAGAKLGVKELNAAGGILGAPVEWVDGDDGTSPDVANATVDRFIAQGVQVIVGAGASGISLAVLPKVVAAGRLMISPSATSDALTQVDDHGLFFRTSPPDLLQAKALTDIVMRDGAQKVVIIARDDSYGTGLEKNLVSDLTTNGVKAANIRGMTYKARDKYDEVIDLEAMFTPIAKTVRQFGPDAVVMIGFDESALLLKALLAEKVKLHS
jgi:ABC-type branched-subunit amino acid transport system substrate-binding protein